MKKIWKSLIAATMAAVMMTGCGGGGASDDSSDSASSADKSAKTDIVIGMGSDISSLNPYKQNDINSCYVARSLYSNLIRVTPDNKFVGDLAENWEIIDPKTAKFTLKDAKFSNGEPVTSEDVKYSIETQKASSKVGHLVEFIEDVEVVDDKNFVMHLNKETNSLISSLAHACSVIMCKSYCEGLEAEGKNVDDYPMGSGQYIFDEWVASSTVTLKKNPDYFDPERAAQNDSITFKVIPEESARTIALETGDVDMLVDVSSTDAQKIRENEKLAMTEFDMTAIEYLCINCEKSPFDDVKVRQALNHAIKKEDVLIVAANGEGKIMDTYFTPVAIGYYGTEKTYEYNPEKAKELLKEAGYENGFEITCLVSSPARAKAATVIQENLSKVGITMNIEQMESATFFEKINNGEHDVCITGWVPNAEADNTYRPLFMSEKSGPGGNRSFYKNPEVDKLVDEAAVSLDQAQIDANRGKVLEIVSEDAIWVPLFSKGGMIASQKDLQGIVGSPIRYQEFWSLHY